MEDFVGSPWFMAMVVVLALGMQADLLYFAVTGQLNLRARFRSLIKRATGFFEKGSS